METLTETLAAFHTRPASLSLLQLGWESVCQAQQLSGHHPKSLSTFSSLGSHQSGGQREASLTNELQSLLTSATYPSLLQVTAHSCSCSLVNPFWGQVQHFSYSTRSTWLTRWSFDQTKAPGKGEEKEKLHYLVAICNTENTSAEDQNFKMDHFLFFLFIILSNFLIGSQKFLFPVSLPQLQMHYVLGLLM